MSTDLPGEEETSDIEFEPRAWITNSLTGDVKPVLKSDVQGLDEWADAWAVDPELPSRVGFSAWQMADDEHPAGTGTPAYRVVFKTIRTVIVPSLNFDFPNLRVSFLNGAVTWGEPRFTNALDGRREGEYLVPQWGKLNLEGDAPGYTALIDRAVNIEAHEETTPEGNFVEVLYHLSDAEDLSWAEKLAAGRAGTASFTAALDLLFGERVVGPTLTEEVGALFDDWHWNREIGGRTVAMEGQARLDLVPAQDIAGIVKQYIDRSLAFDAAERGRVRIASQYYWRADKDSDSVLAFLSYWLSIEALELGENSNIAPLKRSIASLLDVELTRVATGISQIYRLRNKLAHGKLGHVERLRVEEVAAVASALLEHHAIGHVSPKRLESMRDAILDR